MVCGPAEKKEARSSAAGQLGGWHSSKLASPHSLNWHGAHHVRQRSVLEGPVANCKNGLSSRGTDEGHLA